MTQTDGFGHDPAVQMMRRVFRQMETRQAQIISRAGLSPFDPLLRQVRESALGDFEREWARQSRSRNPVTEADYATLYETILLKHLKGTP